MRADLASEQPRGRVLLGLDVESVQRTILQVGGALSVARPERRDFAQEAWVYLLIKRAAIERGFREECAPRTYLSRIVRNFGINWLRRHDSRRGQRSVTELDQLNSPIATREYHPDAGLARIIHDV